MQSKQSYSMWIAEWTDSHHETNTRFSEMCEVPDIVHVVIYIKYSQGTDLRCVELTWQCLAMQ